MTGPVPRERVLTGSAVPDAASGRRAESTQVRPSAEDSWPSFVLSGLPDETADSWENWDLDLPTLSWRSHNFGMRLPAREDHPRVIRARAEEDARKLQEAACNALAQNVQNISLAAAPQSHYAANVGSSLGCSYGDGNDDDDDGRVSSDRPRQRRRVGNMGNAPSRRRLADMPPLSG